MPAGKSLQLCQCNTGLLNWIGEDCVLVQTYPSDIFMLKVNSVNTRRICEIIQS